MTGKRNSTTVYTATAADGTQLHSSESASKAVAVARHHAWKHKVATKADEHNRLGDGPLKAKRTIWDSKRHGGFDF